MAPSVEDVRTLVETYLATLSTGTANDMVKFYADGATLEDPVGTEPRTTSESIREFYAAVEPLDITATLQTLRVSGWSAAFVFELVTKVGENTLTLSPIEVLDFDADLRITSMRAYWSPEDMVTT